MTSSLKIVKTTHRPVIVDIYADWRAEIAARDWKACHTEGDRNPPLELSARPKWKGWRA